MRDLPPQMEGCRRWKHWPVPYINVWSGEGTDRDWVIRNDPLCGPGAGRPAVFAVGQPGRGRPDFTKQCPQRQRECTILGLCQICHRTVPTDERLVVWSSLSVEAVEVEGFDRPVKSVTEPWLCPECAEFALAVCPGLLRRQRTEDLALVRTHRWKIILSTGYIEGRLEAYSLRVRPVMWAKIVLLDAEVVEHLVARHA